MARAQRAVFFASCKFQLKRYIANKYHTIVLFSQNNEAGTRRVFPQRDVFRPLTFHSRLLN